MKKYLLYPFDKSDLKNSIFNGPFGFLRDYLKEMNIDLQTYDMGNIFSADKLLFFNHQLTHLDQCLKFGRKKEDLILFLFEPEVVYPKQYKKYVWNNYGTIFSCRDDILEKNPSFHKLRYPQEDRFRSNLPPYESRRFLTLINSNWYSYLPNEVYSTRRKAIRYFENHSDNFDLFGHGWNNNSILHPINLYHALKYNRLMQYTMDILDGLQHYQSYRGSVPNKYTTLSQYRFAICFENETNTRGYITEKIFDCFFSGTIPIYLGAENINVYVPSTCYIDMKKFKDFQELHSYLKTIDKEMFTKIQLAGQEFIHSNQFIKWKPESICRDITNALLFKR